VPFAAAAQRPNGVVVSGTVADQTGAVLHQAISAQAAATVSKVLDAIT
jgi:hypothetical protein